ncbi:homoaconitate hydratase [Ceratobasidium sp. AG-Ba]|nr:homoaconitate hydratase [Ceratobasidium sp. AG-Ba]
MHPYALLAAVFAAPALAQEVNSTYIAGLLAALNGAGLTSLANTTQSISNNSNGTALLAQLSQGQKTVFAPNNAAFSAVPGDVSSNTNRLVSILSYHVVDGHLNASEFAASPSHTIARTFLNNPEFVTLEGGRSQVIVAERASNGTVTILEATRNTTVVSSTAYENLIVHVVDRVLAMPDDISDTVEDAGLSSLDGALDSTDLDDALERAHGITIFAPTNAAFQSALASLGGQAQNNTVISAILANHVINGTSVYSTGLTANSYSSAGGQAFSFSSNSSGNYVTSGQSSARIVRADIPVENGVVHLIENVLANTASDPGAAASAVASQSSVAATATSIPGQSAGGSGPAPSGSPSNNASLRTAGTLPGTAVILSVTAAAMGAFLGGMLVF